MIHLQDQQVAIPHFTEISKMPNPDGSETMHEKIERIKREENAGTADQSAIAGARGTQTSTSDPQGIADGKARPSAQPVGESGGAVRGSDGTGASKTKSGDSTSHELGDAKASVGGERIRARSASIVPESNDVMLGDQSSRLGEGAKGPLEVDGSTSPHDATSEGGSRQEAALAQVGAAKDASVEANKNPAFQAEAKARTI